MRLLARVFFGKLEHVVLKNQLSTLILRTASQIKVLMATSLGLEPRQPETDLLRD